jgi:hypothetical protein
MTKNLILGLVTGALLVFLALIFTGNLAWQKPLPPDEDLQASGQVLERMIEMHEPKILTIGGKELLYLPLTRQSGMHISVDHKFYTYEDGQFKEAKLGQN